MALDHRNLIALWDLLAMSVNGATSPWGPVYIKGPDLPDADVSDRELFVSMEYVRPLTIAPAAGYMRIPGVGQAPL